MKLSPTNIIALFPIFAIGFYTFGKIHNESFMIEMGLEVSIFPLTYDELLFEGGVRLLAKSLFTVAVAVVVAQLVYVAAEAALNPKINALISSLKQKLPQTRSQHSWDPFFKNDFLVIAKQCFHIVLGIFLAYTFFIAIILTADRSGKNSANNLKDSVRLGKYPPTTIISRHNSNSVIEGVLIRCNDNFCAYRTENMTRTVSISDILELQNDGVVRVPRAHEITTPSKP